MFLSRRATQAEYFDWPDRPPVEIAGFHRSLARVNRCFVFAEPFQRLLPKLLGNQHCSPLSLLDLGAGNGSLGSQLAIWAAKRGWEWRFTNLDVNLPALRLAGTGRNVAASALALPFRDASFDIVIASQMTHHLNDEEVRRHLREAWRVARAAVFITDLHRNAALYLLLWLLLHLRRYPEHFRHDGLLSVRRGFRVRELQALADAAGWPAARVRLYFGARVILHVRKC